MSKNLKYALWIVAVPFIAAVIALLFFPSAPVSSSQAQANYQKAQVTPEVAAPVPAPEPNFSDLLNALENDPQSISRITFLNGSHRVIVERQGQKPLTLAIPTGGEQELLAKASKAQVPIVANDSTVTSPSFLLTSVLPLTVLIGVMTLLWWLGRRDQRQMLSGQMAAPAKSKTVDPIKKVTFDEVAGCDEAVKELRRVVKSLVNADIYVSFGAKLPKGILLVGPPGTGKTLLAKAVAGETDGTFDASSGSDFVEMYVGVGASRVREKFKGARAKVKQTGKPVILFIDEIDAVGGKRGSGTGSGGHQEREQTLNAILVEMDGVKSNDGIIVMAATNRADMLDAALLRPGRFDCHVQVDLPNLEGREKIFAIHTRNKPLAADASLKVLASCTYGYSGAEIEGACNRAAINAAERYSAQCDALKAEGKTEQQIAEMLKREITLAELEEGAAFVKYGAALNSRQKALMVADKHNTAIHEAGHALAAAAMLPHANPVTKITILMRGRALGYVQQMPDHDQVSLNDKQALARIIVAMAGRAAQEVYTNTVDAGASNDFEQATGMARMMVTKWGMTKIGRISVGERGESPLGMGSSGGNIAFGDELANEIDREVRRIVEECYRVARMIVDGDKERLEKLVALLMEKETVLKPEWEKLVADTPSKLDPKALQVNLSA